VVSVDELWCGMGGIDALNNGKKLFGRK